MALEDWQALGIVCGALLAALTLLGLLWRKVVLPVWLAAWRTIRRLNEVADDLLGDEAKKIPSLKKQVTDLSRELAAVRAEVAHAQDDHVARWHSPQVNGPAPVQRRR